MQSTCDEVSYYYGHMNANYCIKPSLGVDLVL